MVGGTARRDPKAYSALDVARDLDEARAAPRQARRSAQADRRPGENGAAEAAEVVKKLATGAPLGLALVPAYSGDDALFVACLRDGLPGLKKRLDAAATAAKDENTRLHLREMSAQMARLTKMRTAW